MAEKVTQKQRKENLQNQLPAEIIVLGKTFKVNVSNLKGLYGDCDTHSKVIRIHQGLDINQARITLFHEAIHASFAISGHSYCLSDEQEEGIVRMLEHAFYHCVDVDKLDKME